jgi:hypothetical protein
MTLDAGSFPLRRERRLARDLGTVLGQPAVVLVGEVGVLIDP